MMIANNINYVLFDSLSKILFFLTHKTDAIVNHCHLAFGVMTICRLHHLFLQPLESLPNIVPQHLPTHLNRDLIVDLLVVKKQRSEVDPNASFLQCTENCINIVKNIVSSVQKETSRYSIELFRSLLVHFLELPAYDCELWRIFWHIGFEL